MNELDAEVMKRFEERHRDNVFEKFEEQLPASKAARGRMESDAELVGEKLPPLHPDEIHYRPRDTFNEIDAENPVAQLAGEAAENLPRPTGWKILIAIPRLKAATKGGILKASETLEREQTAMIIGFVIALGPDAYHDKERYPSGPWCKEGDFVLMRSYAGTRFMYLGQEYRMINEDVVEGVTPDPRGVTKAG